MIMHSLNIAKSGMSAQQAQMDVTSHNLANVSTTGFKKQRAMFEDLLYQQHRQVGAPTDEQNNLPTGYQVGSGVRVVGTSVDFTQGTPSETGNDLDLAINGQGFFQIQMPDGTTAYTRDGTFSKNSTGQLVTAGGYPLLDGITVPQEATSLTISKTGLVSITVPGNAEPQQIGQINLATFINPTGLERIGENLYRESGSSGAPQTGTPGSAELGSVMQGFLEASNVNIVAEMVDMIQVQRAYEMNSKAISTSDQMLAKLSQL